MKITVKRSAQWVQARRLETGENVPDKIEVDVDPRAMSLAARKIILDGSCGDWPATWNGPFGSDYCYNRYSGYGYAPPCVDADSPTVVQIDEAILSAAATLDKQREQHERVQRELAERRAEEQRQAEEKQRRLAEARELMRADLERGESYRRDRLTLAEFLASIPEDALRGTLRSVAHSPEAIAALRQRVEDASPVTIFDADDDDDDNE